MYMRNLKQQRSERPEAFAPEVQIMSKTSRTSINTTSQLLEVQPVEEDDSSNSTQMMVVQ
jgi:hypothetical protein